MQRAMRMSFANMLRSLLPLVVICLLIVGWQAFRSSGDVGVRTVDPSSTVQLAAARAGYDLLVPTGLDERYVVTSARTDAGDAGEGDPVTAVLDGAQERGTVDVGGDSWTRSTTADGETALSREAEGVTVLVTGSASDEELRTVAESVRLYSR